jgi:hypothetical protein
MCGLVVAITIRHKRGPWVVWLEPRPSVKPYRVRCKLEETIEQPCSDILEHTPEVCKGAHLYIEYPATPDDHDSCGMCTTSVECKLL